MNLRNLALLGGLAMMLGGCVVAPRPYAVSASYSDGDYYYDNGYYDYNDTPSYEGYYYVRIIFIGNSPYYVGDDRHIRPLPPRVYNHFLRSPYRNNRLPVFSRDNEVRNGYPMSRVVYFNNVPYFVENNRSARPLPNNLQERFRYAPRPGNGPMNGNRGPSMRDEFLRNPKPAYDGGRMAPQPYDRDRPQGGNRGPSSMRDEFLRNPQPADGRDRMAPQPYDRERNPAPADGQERDRMEPPAYERGRMAPQPFGRDREPQRSGGPFNGRMMMPPSRGGDDQRQMPPPRQAQPDMQNSGGMRSGAQADGRSVDRGRNGGNNRRNNDKTKRRGGGDDSDKNNRGGSFGNFLRRK